MVDLYLYLMSRPNALHHVLNCIAPCIEKPILQGQANFRHILLTLLGMGDPQDGLQMTPISISSPISI